MSNSNSTKESSLPLGRNISIEEFRKSELLNYYNSFYDEALIITSNRNLHLQSVNLEFIKFANFIMEPVNKESFLVFLTPVFQHLYLLLFCNKGKSDAEKFSTFCRNLPIPPKVFTSLSECETLQDLQQLIKSFERIRVKLSSGAWHILIKWLKDCFSETAELFNVLRVLHENFHVDIYHDDDEEFDKVDFHIQRLIQGWHMANEESVTVENEAQNALQEWAAAKRIAEVASKSWDKEVVAKEIAEAASKSSQEDAVAKEIAEAASKSSQEDQNIATENTSELEIDTAEQSEHKMETDEMSKEAECIENIVAEKLSELKIKTAEKSEPEIKTAEKSDLEIKTAEMSEEPMCIGSESNLGSMFKLRDSAKKYLENLRRLAKEENWTTEQIEKAFLNIPEPTSEEENSALLNRPAPTITEDTSALLNLPESNVTEETSEMDDHQMDFLEDTAPIVDEDSVKQIIDQLMSPNPDIVEEVEKEDIVGKENFENTDEDSNDATKKEDGNLDKLKSQYFTLKKFYKSNFHSAFPVTISAKDVVCATELSPDLKYLACSFASFKICTWHLDENFNLEPIGTLKDQSRSIVNALSFDSSYNTLISGSQDGAVRIWDIEESIIISEIFIHSGPVYSVCASPNSKHFLSGSEDKKVALIWYDEEYTVRGFCGHTTTAINCVRFHPNCAYFASASSDGKLFLFKINDESRPVRMFAKHTAKVCTLSFSPCGKHLASADVKGVLIIWDILTYRPLKTLETGKEIKDISYDRNGYLIAALFKDKSWKVYNIEEDNADVVIEAESVEVEPKSVHFSEDNKLFIIQYVHPDKKEKAKTIIKKPLLKEMYRADSTVP